MLKETKQINTMSYMALTHGQNWDANISPDHVQEAWEDLDDAFEDDADWQEIRDCETIWASYHEIDGKQYAIGSDEPTSNGEARLFMVEIG